MFYKTSFLLGMLLFSCCAAFSQLTDLEEKKPAVINGIEYGYIVKNEQTKNAKGEEYSRYEITFYALNNSGCTKLFANRAFSMLPMRLTSLPPTTVLTQTVKGLLQNRAA